MLQVLGMMFFMLATIQAKAELHIDFVGNKVVVEQNGVVTEVTIDKEDLLVGDSDEIVRKVLKKLEENK